MRRLEKVFKPQIQSTITNIRQNREQLNQNLQKGENIRIKPRKKEHFGIEKLFHDN